MGKWGEPLGGGDRSTHVFIGLGGSGATLKGEGARVPPEWGGAGAPQRRGPPIPWRSWDAHGQKDWAPSGPLLTPQFSDVRLWAPAGQL